MHAPDCIIRQICTERFTVTVEAQPETDLDLSWDEDGETRRRLENGSLCAFTVKASVTYRGKEVAVDWLGECVYESPWHFMHSEGKPFAEKGGYFGDMVRTVCQQARRNLTSYVLPRRGHNVSDGDLILEALREAEERLECNCVGACMGTCTHGIVTRAICLRLNEKM